MAAETPTIVACSFCGTLKFLFQLQEDEEITCAACHHRGVPTTFAVAEAIRDIAKAEET